MKNSMVFFDAFGLAVFTIIGAQVAMMQPSHTFPVVVVMGVVTGVAGGVLRDIVCNEVPLIFQKEIYARLFSHYLNWSLPILHSREHNSPNNDKDC